MWPQGMLIFGPRGIIFKFFISKPIFSLCDLDMQQTRTIWTINKEGHIRTILAKFGQNPAGSLGALLTD